MSRALTIGLGLLFLAGCGGGILPNAPTDDWTQWAHDAAHTGASAIPAQHVTGAVGQWTLDPFVDRELEIEGALHVHYAVPLVSGNDVFVVVKSGAYTGRGTWQTQVWNVQRLRWQNGSLVVQWTYASDWRPVPDGGALGGWQPLFQPALAAGRLFVPGLAGVLHVLDPDSGVEDGRVDPFGTADPTLYVASGVSADAQGQVYYTALKLDPADPWRKDAGGGWLVRGSAAGEAIAVPFSSWFAGAPSADEPCLTTFSSEPLPWPPSADAVPPSAPCGSQRPAVNAVPAVASDGTVYVVSRAHWNGAYGYLVAVRPDLAALWTASLRARFADGCGVAAADGGVLPPDGAPGGCRAGSVRGVDPTTNGPGGGLVLDESSASPVVAPDGAVFYGASTRYDYGRGHLMKFGSDGSYRGTYAAGGNTTPAIARRGSSYVVVVSENHAADVGSYCDDAAFCGASASGAPHSIRALAGDTLAPVWSFAADHEWRVNAPATDSVGGVYANTSDGSSYALDANGAVVSRLVVGSADESASTPVAIDGAGRVYVQNAGRLLALGP